MEECARVADSKDHIMAEVGMNEGALGMISRGYTEATRCLNFRVRFYGGEGAKAAVRIIDSYNDFAAECVVEQLDTIMQDCRTIVVGRENSPVIYIEAMNEALVPNIMLAMRDAHADEVDAVSPTIVRAWWG